MQMIVLLIAIIVANRFAIFAHANCLKPQTWLTRKAAERRQGERVEGVKCWH